MRIRGWHWAVAFAVALLVHVGVALALLWQPPDSGATSAGMGGVKVSLGPAGGAPGSAAPVAPETPQSVEPVETPAAEPVEATPVETAETIAKAETSQPQPAEETTAVEAPPVKSEEVEVAEEQTPVETEASPSDEAVAKNVTQPSPKPEPPEKQSPPKPTRQQTQPAEAPTGRTARAEPSNPGAGGKAGTQANPSAGRANDSSSGGGVPGEQADYLAQLRAWLEKHKQYPRRAQMRRQEGVALLHIVMNRQGRVVDYELQQSSGYNTLDREVVAMIERANPLPAMPDAMSQSRLELVVPVQFSLR